MKAQSSPYKSALLGFLFSLPFLVLNFIVALRIEPFYGWIGYFPVIRRNPVIPLLLLLLFPVGTYISIHPMLQDKKEKRSKYLLNMIMAGVLTLFFLVVFSALGEELYRCDILKIPNCD